MLMRYQLKLDGLVNEMLDRLSEEVWKSETTTFFDPAMAGGQFIGQVIARLRSYGHSDENINGRVFGMECSKLMVTVVQNKYKIGTYWVGDINYEFKNMKFDVVLGNPPYGKTDDTSSYTNIWSDFVIKSFNLLNEDGFLLFVSPMTWATLKDETRKSQTGEVLKLIREYSLILNLDECSRYFPTIGSTFSWYLLSKIKKENEQTLIITPTDKFYMSIREVKVFPIMISEISIGLINKLKTCRVFKKDKSPCPSGNMINDKDKTELNINSYPYRVQYSDGTVKWSDKEHKHQYHKKIIFPNQTSRDYPIYDTQSAPANRGAVYLLQSDEEGMNFIMYMKSKIMKFFISQQRFHHGLLNTEVISNIPLIDLSKTWTDTELYAHFNLTQEEIDLIESTVND